MLSRCSPFAISKMRSSGSAKIDDADWLAHAVQGIAVLWRRRDFAFSLIEEERASETQLDACPASALVVCSSSAAGRGCPTAASHLAQA